MQSNDDDDDKKIQCSHSNFPPFFHDDKNCCTNVNLQVYFSLIQLNYSWMNILQVNYHLHLYSSFIFPTCLPSILLVCKCCEYLRKNWIHSYLAFATNENNKAFTVHAHFYSRYLHPRRGSWMSTISWSILFIVNSLNLIRRKLEQILNDHINCVNLSILWLRFQWKFMLSRGTFLLLIFLSLFFLVEELFSVMCTHSMCCIHSFPLLNSTYIQKHTHRLCDVSYAALQSLKRFSCANTIFPLHKIPICNQASGSAAHISKTCSSVYRRLILWLSGNFY